jgi:hypothetical protein
MGDEDDLQAAHAIMRYAAQLEGRPAAELLAQLPPLPLGSGEMPIGGDSGATYHVALMLYQWPGFMRRCAPPGQDFLLQLPGGLGELPPLLVHAGLAACDAELRVDDALKAKERGNTAFMAGDTAGALREYNTGIDHLRALTALHLIRNSEAINRGPGAARTPYSAPSDPTLAVAYLRQALAPLIQIELFQYQSHQNATSAKEVATILLQDLAPLPPALRLPDCNDLPSLAGCFWRQLVTSFMEPYGGVNGLLVNQGAWPHPMASMHIPDHFVPF